MRTARKIVDLIQDDFLALERNTEQFSGFSANLDARGNPFASQVDLDDDA